MNLIQTIDRESCANLTWPQSVFEISGFFDQTLFSAKVNVMRPFFDYGKMPHLRQGKSCKPIFLLKIRISFFIAINFWQESITPFENPKKIVHPFCWSAICFDFLVNLFVSCVSPIDWCRTLSRACPSVVHRVCHLILQNILQIAPKQSASFSPKDLFWSVFKSTSEVKTKAPHKFWRRDDLDQGIAQGYSKASASLFRQFWSRSPNIPKAVPPASQ